MGNYDMFLKMLRQDYHIQYPTDFAEILLVICRYCGRKTKDYYIDGDSFPWQVYRQFDHVRPKSIGGADEVDNIVVSCAECNSKKGAKLLIDSKMEMLSIDYLRQKYDPSLRYIPDSRGSRIKSRVRRSRPN